MTIHSDWIKIFKKEVPTAFSTNLPSSVQVRTVFIDGQIKLMKSSHIKDWDVFVRIQFIDVIHAIFNKYGASVCVLAFDDYDYVPTAKGPTQRCRSRHVPFVNFNEQDELPKEIPDDFAAMMRNRTFKCKVIAYVVHCVRQHFIKNLMGRADKTLIIDFKNSPQILGKAVELSADTFSNQDAKRGECDIKAFNYIGMGPLLIISTDGDYVPMALIQLKQNTGNDMVFIHRIKINVSKKRQLQSTASSREFEFVNVQELRNKLDLDVRNKYQLETEQWSVCLAALIAMTGCDFCMNLPQIGPIKVWDARHLLFQSNHHLQIACVQTMIQLYQATMLQGIKSFVQSEQEDDFKAQWQTTIQRLKDKKPTSSVVSKLWTFERLTAHSKNILWTTQYWTNLQFFSDPLLVDSDGQTLYGFVKIKNIVHFEHQVQNKKY